MNPRTLLLVVIACAGCVDGERQRARGAEQYTDNWEQEQYANTNPYGDGSEGTAYYGAPGPSTPPVRHSASPDPVPARSPASPRSAD